MAQTYGIRRNTTRYDTIRYHTARYDGHWGVTQLFRGVSNFGHAHASLRISTAAAAIHSSCEEESVSLKADQSESSCRILRVPRIPADAGEEPALLPELASESPCRSFRAPRVLANADEELSLLLESLSGDCFPLPLPFIGGLVWEATVGAADGDTGVASMLRLHAGLVLIEPSGAFGKGEKRARVRASSQHGRFLLPSRSTERLA